MTYPAVSSRAAAGLRVRTQGAALAPAFALSLVMSGLLLWFFHDRYWYPTDDGFHAHIADRLLSGEVLGRDIQDIHPGYIHFLHAAAFRLFGNDLLSLRYPLIATGILQSVFVFLLLRRRSLLLAAIGSVAVNAVGVIQFQSPNSNWHCLTLTIVLAWWLTVAPKNGWKRLVVAGILLGLVTWLRHLTGIWVAMGTIAFALLERSGDGRGRQLILARVQVAIMLVAIVAYLAYSPETEPGGVIFMAAAPMAIFGWMLVRLRTKNRDVLVALGQLLCGVTVATLPFLAYHLVHGSMAITLRDLIEASAAELDLPFYGSGWYGVLPIAALYQVLSSFEPARIVNGVYWTLLPLASALNGALVLRHLQKQGDPQGLALPMIAVFYGLVALLLEGPLYLYYTLGLSIVSLLWTASTSSARHRYLAAATASFISVVAIAFHAGQTRERTAVQILRGERVTDFSAQVPCPIERCSLSVSPEDAALYGHLVQTIRSHSGSNDAILALPYDAELYYLAQRRNPFRFYSSAQGIIDGVDLAAVLRTLERDPPRVVIFRPADKYNTARSAEVMRVVKARYRYQATIGGAEIYTY